MFNFVNYLFTVIICVHDTSNRLWLIVNINKLVSVYFCKIFKSNIYITGQTQDLQPGSDNLQAPQTSRRVVPCCQEGCCHEEQT